jgi:hypothetical protein
VSRARLRPILSAAALLVLGATPATVGATEFDLRGFADLRMLRAGGEKAWQHGGLGKFRWDGGGETPGVLAVPQELSLVGTVRPVPSVSAIVHLRVAPDQDTMVDAIEAFARWRPVSTSAWRFSVRGGAFFPPVSLENDGIGWTSLWTLTPSAINTWVGEELRTVGSEASLTWRGEYDQITLTGAVFGWNDFAGIQVAYKGWGLHDRWTGLFEHPRLADEIGVHSNTPNPKTTQMFSEADDRVGVYGGITWSRDDAGRVTMLAYDNLADSNARKGQLAWRTRFLSVGAEVPLGDAFSLLTQGIAGDTTLAEGQAGQSVTDFHAAYVLLGWQSGDWRLAGRLDMFATRERGPPVRVELSEHGHALTLAATWRPRDWLRVTGEVIRANSDRAQREVVGVAREQTETQVQMGLRVLF